MLLTVCGVSWVARARSARVSAPLIRSASKITRRLCALAPSRLVPATARMARLAGGSGAELTVDIKPVLSDYYLSQLN